jgi:glycosyltransferase involved in cell wall biosynthesis
MPAFRVEKHRIYFEQAIKGIIDQSYTNWELIIVCDGYSEATRHTIEDVLREYDGHISQRIDVYRSDRRRGPGRIRNFAHQYAKGNYITFHDSDDFSVPERFEMLMDAMDDDGIIASNMGINTVFEDDPLEEEIAKSKKHKKRRKRVKSYSGATLGLLIKWKKVRAPFDIPSAILSMDLFEEMGGFERRFMFSADATLAIKLGYYRELLCMPPVPIIKESLFVWNRHSNSVTTTQSNQYALRKCQKAQRKPLRRVFYNKLIDCEICFGDSKGDIKDALMISDNLSNSPTLEKIYSIKNLKKLI